MALHSPSYLMCCIVTDSIRFPLDSLLIVQGTVIVLGGNQLNLYLF